MNDIKLDYETACGITKSYLREDYESICEYLLKENIHPMDKVAYTRAKAAIETLFEVWLGDTL